MKAQVINIFQINSGIIEEVYNFILPETNDQRFSGYGSDQNYTSAENEIIKAAEMKFQELIMENIPQYVNENDIEGILETALEEGYWCDEKDEVKFMWGNVQ